MNSADSNKNSSGGVRGALTKLVLWNSALSAYNRLSYDQRKTVVDVGIRSWLLAKLNPEKTKQIKNALTSSGKVSVADRLAELKSLHDQGLITETEYSSKRADILRGL